MITQCQNPDCKRFFWRWRKDHPPKGHCSVSCYEDHRPKKSLRPDKPANILHSMYRHRADVHLSTSILAWFDCAECERLEGIYRESLDWHTAKVSEEIALNARSREADR